MQIKTITVRAGRVLSHPTEEYANIRPSIELVAEIDQGEDFKQATKQLQAQAEQLVEEHANQLIESLRDQYELDRSQRRLAALEGELLRKQSELKEEREAFNNRFNPQPALVGDVADGEADNE